MLLEGFTVDAHLEAPESSHHGKAWVLGDGTAPRVDTGNYRLREPAEHAEYAEHATAMMAMHDGHAEHPEHPELAVC